ncbi:MAG: ATP-binding protein [Candidatus Protistobacter heckmanni]|nr:ATP-binding protein [Candidatus Protistobacter heckmanni]
MINAQTLLIAIGIGNFVLAALVAPFARNFTDSPGATKTWLLARLVEGMGFELVALRGELPFPVSFWAGNFFILCGWWLELAATWEFLERRRVLKTAAIAAALSCAAFTVIAFIDERANVRTLLPSAISVLVYGLLGLAFLREWRRGSAPALLMGIMNLTLVAGRIPRLLEALGNSGMTVLTNSTGQSISYLSFFAASMFNGFAFLMLINERSRRETERAKEELRQHKDNLEVLVLERTRELRMANSELETFSYSVSHDLRTPLRSVSGFSHLLAEKYGGGMDETGRNYLARLQSGARRMGELIEDLLRLSHLTRSPLVRAPVDLGLLAQEIVDELRSAEPQRAVTVRIAPGLSVLGDARLLRVALENLLGNAWKYTSKRGDGLITFDREAAAGETSGFVYAVRDNGVGFDGRFAEHMFRAFERLPGSGEFEGSGIGLTIVERHGGRIWAEAELGAGAAFLFTLPGDASASSRGADAASAQS